MQTEQSPAVVQSRDGTTIAYERSGAGPAVVLVAGAFCDRGWFDSLAAALAADFTVYSYDRRGRGDSGDSGDSRAFSIDAEVEDLRAVVAATGETPLVYGLSSGAALALEAAAQAVPMRKLAVYEAPYMDDDQRDETAQSDLERLIAAGDREGAVTRFLDLTGASPGWSTRSSGVPIGPTCAPSRTPCLTTSPCVITAVSRSTGLPPLPSLHWSCTAVTVVNGHLLRRRESL